MPDLIRPPAHRYPLGLTPAFGVKKTKFNPFRVFGKQREIHPLAVPRGSHWVRLTAPDRCFRAIHKKRRQGLNPSERDRHADDVSDRRWTRPGVRLQFIAEIALLSANIVPCLGNGICMLLDVEARVRVKITFLRTLAGDNMFAKRKSSIYAC